jgi:hypothetical protein
MHTTNKSEGQPQHAEHNMHAEHKKEHTDFKNR